MANASLCDSAQKQAGSHTGACDRNLTHRCGQHLRGFPGSLLEEVMIFSCGGWGVVVITWKGKKKRKHPFCKCGLRKWGLCKRLSLGGMSLLPLLQRLSLPCQLHPRALDPSSTMTSCNKAPSPRNRFIRT